MWSADDFPGADSVPWQLLIRARYAHEIDAVVASVVVHQISRVAAVPVAQQIAKAATAAVVESPRSEANSEQRLNALSRVADFDDLCPPNWPFHWPPRPKHDFDDISDPVLAIVVQGALDLIRTAGSEQLNKSLGQTLQEVGR